MQISASNLLAAQAYVRPTSARTQNVSSQTFSTDMTAATGSADAFSPMAFKTVDKADVVAPAPSSTNTSSASPSSTANASPTTPANGYGAARLGSMVDITV